MSKSVVDFKDEARDTLEGYLLAFSSKEKAFEKFSQWMAGKAGTKNSAIWFYFDETKWDKDTGISVEIFEFKRRKFRAVVDFLFGKKTAGIEVKVPVLEYESGRFFVGFGLVKNLTFLSRPPMPSLSFSVKFK